MVFFFRRNLQLLSILVKKYYLSARAKYVRSLENMYARKIIIFWNEEVILVTKETVRPISGKKAALVACNHWRNDN